MTQSPLLGFNNNVKHRGRLFHIQTEDSGVRHPHVITHLFMDGGRILKTIKTSYAEHLGSDKLAQVVRDLMKEQHKMMFIALRDGQFDHVLDSVPPPSMSGPPVHPNQSFPAVSAGTVPATAMTLPPDVVVSTSVPAPTASAPVARPSAPIVPTVKAPSTAMPAVKTPSTTMPAVGSPPARPPSGTLAAVRPSPAAATAGSPPAATTRPQSPPSSTGLRAAASAEGAGPSTGIRPVPRREAPDLFGAQTPEAGVVNVVAEQGGAAGAPGSSSKVAASKEQPGSGRYAASRPAAIFATARAADAGGSIFGDDLISEKSLDEVILSYLSDDLDSSSSKK
jgi:hypothetical protein